MPESQLDVLRGKIDKIDEELLILLNKRAKIVESIGKVKETQSTKRYDPVRERQLFDRIAQNNEGPFSTTALQQIFKQIFQVSLELQKDDNRSALLVSRKKKPEDTIVNISGIKVGDGKQQFVMGPCAVESYEQVYQVAEQVKKHGIGLIRGGAFKPRTSPYDFQGLGFEGLELLRNAADAFDLKVISEIMTPSDVEKALDYVDVIQVGARNMQNFDLLKEVGKTNKPVLLKRGLAATIEEFIYAAEYIMSKGNDQIILCERGIRTYEKATRNTLDITSVPILKKETHLPVAVDVVHSTGRRDLLLPAAKAALAIGADLVMAEVHPDPAVALSDSAQQMNFEQFDSFMKAINPCVNVFN
ncbi:bifunctional 3-deoxy-7-phosphoheptulonate synthase/chorismate mutase [Terrilactibacillus laevilacticus]|uniref:Bifunctional 3-deoxy-7-phosphoheptulonate synthase/chorismate mutase n=1 Tax=Terrilactibacillus laevilacticus TaxID=1380157 RepID=A0ABW5PSF6_9BACI|nr:bifunctional 3-deoxy-7-phosphoheptulonate synthase/chorismate mutase [Terrilactibacillus laevilacticus]